jgi:predicted CXXCH cytochrome family protein
MKTIKIAISLCLLGAGLLSIVTQVSALELIYPEDKTWVPYSHLMVIKTGDVPGLSIEINGAKSEIFDMVQTRAAQGGNDFVKVVPEFAPGQNLITLYGHNASGGVVTKTEIDIYYREDPYERTPEGYRPYVMHTPQREALCLPCHNMNPTGDQLEESSVELNPCGSCHYRMLERKYVHGPAGVYECVFCHDPMSKPSRYKPVGGDMQICMECHEDKFEAINSDEFVHGPVSVGMCSVCHDPHATNYSGQMFRATNDVCTGCHAAVDLNSHVVRSANPHPLGGVPDPLASAKEMTCASCHDPHGGSSRFFFPADVSSAMALCQKCHQK